jgi:hypothetical protein
MDTVGQLLCPRAVWLRSLRHFPLQTPEAGPHGVMGGGGHDSQPCLCQTPPRGKARRVRTVNC